MDAGTWPQAIVEFADRRTIEPVAVTHLHPALIALETTGEVSAWWFVRKHPCWRLRIHPTRSGMPLAALLDRLAADGAIRRWVTGIYEPETFAFGGRGGMDLAHTLFRHDSRHVLDYLADPTRAAGLRRRELGILLVTALLRGAGQDWYEHGDVWAKVAHHRPTTEPPRHGATRWRAAMHRLMTVDLRPTGPLLDGGRLASIADWLDAFASAGRQLADLASSGGLERGLRAVLAHHVIFAWNRLGLPLTDQQTLCALAKDVVMHTSDHDVSTTNPADGTATLAAMTTTEQAKTDSPGRLRAALADRLRAQGTITTGRVEEAVRAVPRHLFLPGVPVEQAYADDMVYTKQDATGTSISAASQPTIVAMMLEQLDTQPGQRILEAGAGTGYNAGLLGHLVGPAGQVVTIDVDDDIVTAARTHLNAAGISNVTVLRGDGAHGHPGGAPYDRIIATVGVFDLPPAWLDQLATNGLLVVPLRLRGGVTRSIAFAHDHNGLWRARSNRLCSFMPLRDSIAGDPRHTIALTDDQSVTLHAHQDQDIDPAALVGVLDHPAHRVWTEVQFRGQESLEWLDLYLTCALPNAISRMLVQKVAVDAGLVDPQFRWGAMATTDHDSIAYLTLRTSTGGDGTNRYEVGVIGHGPAGDHLADHVADQVRRWNHDHRDRPVEFTLQPTTPGHADHTLQAQFVFRTSHHQLGISWQ